MDYELWYWHWLKFHVKIQVYWKLYPTHELTLHHHLILILQRRETKASTIFQNKRLLAAQETALAPFLLNFHTTDFRYDSEMCYLQKLSDATAVVRCVGQEKEEEYRRWRDGRPSQDEISSMMKTPRWYWPTNT